MGILEKGKIILGQVVEGAFKNLSNGGNSLKEAASTAPNDMGCYKLYLEGTLKYVGKAEYGIRHRFVQYYNGTTTSYPSGKKIYENRDLITVSWTVCKTRDECRALEAQWIRIFHPEWNVQGGWKKY